MVQTVKFSQFANINLTTTTNQLVGVSADAGGINFQSPFTVAWTTTARPSPPYPGLQGYNSTLNVPEYWNGTAWLQLESGAGNVTEVDTGVGLVGGPITTTGTISYAPIAASSLWANTNTFAAVPAVTPLTTFLLSANNLFDLTDAATARTNLFLSADVGLSGQVLTSNGTLTPPTWQAAEGSGTVNFGTQNQMAWYATTGNVISGLATSAVGAPGVLVTNSTGQPLISSNGQIPGTLIANNANPGNIGEFIADVVMAGSAVAFSNGVIADLTSIILTPGDWDIWGNLFFTGATVTTIQGWTNTQSATMPDPSRIYYNQPNPLATASGFAVPFQRYTASSFTFIFISGVVMGSGALRCSGAIYARRAR